MEPYDPNHPDMPPLIDDIPMSEEVRRRFNAEAEELAKAAKEIGFNDDRDAIDRLFEPITTLTFTYAKTMPDCPHEYAVKRPENEQEFAR